MILKKITLTNIRSYKDPVTIEFSKGSSLFEGDIGSGKSTILYGIEFALFGLGDIEGGYLLRKGEKQGFVLLEFDVNGKSYAAYRSLVKRGQGVSQGHGYIIEDGEQVEYSVKEMKARILEILNFNERIQPKTSSLVYRYAIFTPQEMMKEVLQQEPDKRLDTLRRAFGIEEYSTAINNSELVKRELRYQIREINASTERLPQKAAELEEESKRIHQEQSALQIERKQAEKLTASIEARKKEMTDLMPAYEKVIQLETEIPRIQKQITDKKGEKQEKEGEKLELEKELQIIAQAERSLNEMRPKYTAFIKAKEKLIELEPVVGEYRKLELGIEKSRTRISKEKASLEKQIRETEEELTSDEADLEERKDAIKNIETIRTKVDALKEAVKKAKPLTGRIEKLASKIDSIGTRIEGEKEKLAQKQQELNGIKEIGVGAPCPLCKQNLSKQHLADISADYQSEFSKLNQKIAKLDDERKELEKELAKARKEAEQIEAKQVELDELSTKLATMIEQQRSITFDSKKLGDKREKVKQLKQALADEDYALEDRRQLKEFLADQEKIATAKEQYDRLKEEITVTEKTKIESKYSQLEATISRRKTVSEQIGRVGQKIQELERRIQALTQEYESAARQYEENEDIKKKINTLATEKEQLEKEHRQIGESIAARNASITQLQKKVADLTQEIEVMEGEIRQKIVYQQILVWLQEYFVPCLHDVEQYVMASYNEEFDRLFQKWFLSLLEAGDITVGIDDAFTPIINHNGLELDVNSLSGGEKTSVALAYRLALNMMVKKASNALNSNLLMLDEPTDGFSHEQLNRLRDVLDDLNCEQVILVSHEKQLESFVNRVYKITKENNISKVEQIIT